MNIQHHTTSKHDQTSLIWLIVLDPSLNLSLASLNQKLGLNGQLSKMLRDKTSRCSWCNNKYKQNDVMVGPLDQIAREFNIWVSELTLQRCGIFRSLYESHLLCPRHLPCNVGWTPKEHEMHLRNEMLCNVVHGISTCVSCFLLGTFVLPFLAIPVLLDSTTAILSSTVAHGGGVVVVFYLLSHRFASQYRCRIPLLRLLTSTCHKHISIFQLCLWHAQAVLNNTFSGTQTVMKLDQVRRQKIRA